MREDDDKVRIELPTCEDPDCADCAHRGGVFEGTVQEALQHVSDDALERDRVLMEIITEQTQTVVALYKLMEAMAPGSVQVITLDNMFGKSKNDKPL